MAFDGTTNSDAPRASPPRHNSRELQKPPQAIMSRIILALALASSASAQAAFDRSSAVKSATASADGARRATAPLQIIPLTRVEGGDENARTSRRRPHRRRLSLSDKSAQRRAPASPRRHSSRVPSSPLHSRRSTRVEGRPSLNIPGLARYEQRQACMSFVAGACRPSQGSPYRRAPRV